MQVYQGRPDRQAAGPCSPPCHSRRLARRSATMLKSMCAGQRLASEPQDPAAVSLPTSSVPETRGTVAPLQGPRFPPARSLRPLRFCSAAQLPHTRLSLQAPRVPSASLAACSLLLQGEIKAALPSGEHWPWRNAAAARDPARGCHGSPALPGCPRGAGLGRALCRAAPRMAQRLVTSLSPAKATCYLLQLIINLSEMQRVQSIAPPSSGLQPHHAQNSAVAHITRCSSVQPRVLQRLGYVLDNASSGLSDNLRTRRCLDKISHSSYAGQRSSTTWCGRRRRTCTSNWLKLQRH
ncbi:uncharacterized protein LOC129135332 isoform X3 [Pan troglodytes]|uniref:uncharacterized protein LOC129135332 isoform X3 n=1 Tax=Pan troglodytes TaxID=9598 RepID=UPI003013E9A0